MRLFARNTQRAIQLEAVELAHCPFCKNSTPTAAHAPLSRIDCPICGKQILVPGRLDVFLLHEHIGEGEMGSIYRATDETLEREVAIKLIRIGQADSPDRVSGSSAKPAPPVSSTIPASRKSTR